MPNKTFLTLTHPLKEIFFDKDTPTTASRIWTKREKHYICSVLLLQMQMWLLAAMHHREQENKLTLIVNPLSTLPHPTPTPQPTQTQHYHTTKKTKKQKDALPIM